MPDKKDLYSDLTCNSSVALHLIIVSYKCSSDCTLEKVMICYIFKDRLVYNLGSVVQRLDNAIHRINHYPADKC